MGLGIAIRQDDPEDRRGDSTDDLQPNLGAGLLVSIHQRGQEPVEPCPAALGKDGSLDLGRDAQIPRGDGRLEGRQREVRQVVIAPGHSQTPRLEIEQRSLAGVGTADRDPVRG